jgi:undecaprenyl-diphosphatase
LLDLLKVIVLGIVEGITEFLPVSSTGHLIVFVALLRPGFSPGLESTFEIFIQFGAVIAVIVYYRQDIIHQVLSVRTDAGTRRLWLALILSGIPAALVGFLFRDTIKEVLFNPVVVAIALIVGGVLFIVLERYFAGKPTPPTRDITEITPRQAIIIGLLQTLLLIPGVSRAATSIFGGMLVGLDRQAATRYSFFLAIPILGGATVLDLLLSLDEITSGDIAYLVVGALVSGIVAFFAVGWLLRFIARSNFTPFGYYRIAAGIVILILAAFSVV